MSVNTNPSLQLIYEQAVGASRSEAYDAIGDRHIKKKYGMRGIDLFGVLFVVFDEFGDNILGIACDHEVGDCVYRGFGVVVD